jgi:hypothetical protein
MNDKNTTKTATTSPLKAKKVKPTLRQRRTAKLLVDAIENGTEYKTSAEIIKSAGYGTGLQIQPSRVLESVGTIKALEDLGFTEGNAKSVVNSILSNEKAKASDRLKAADMVFKVHGTYAAEKHMTLNIDANVDTQAMLELAERLRNTTQ